MFPSNSYMDPHFSQNQEQIPYPPYPFYPYPFPIRPDPSTQSTTYPPWPHHFNAVHSNGYSYPAGCYDPRPPFPYELPPPKLPSYYHPYFTPMPSYPTNHPQFDHPKSQTHCCGCPNHVCHGRDSQKMKNDEEKPEMDQRKLPNSAYPFFWFPPRNNMGRDEIEKPKKEKNEGQFPWPIVWMPDDEVKEKKEKKDTQLPWPIIWMPEDDLKETKDQNANKPVSEEQGKPTFRIIPLKFLEHGDKDQAEMQKLPVVEKKEGGEKMGREWREIGDKDQAEIKKVPVMEKKEGCGKAGKQEPIKERGEKVTEKKHSKLPPVCLRVDPLPRENQTNGSPKGGKNKKEVKVVDVKSAKDKERKEKEIEAVKGVKEKLQERKIDDVKGVSKPEEDKITKVIKVIDVKRAEGKELKEREIQGEKNLKEKLEGRQVCSIKRANLSEKDAAVLIQSVYRGYNVRRCDPVQKLKRIRDVCKKAQEIRGRLQDVEESATQLESKERLILSENIMSLLLQLDTIQGLHPTVREARKSVARELISLQEKLDFLEKQKVVEAPTNEVQLQSAIQPSATIVSSEGCKLTSEQIESRPSEVPAVESLPTQKEEEKAHETPSEVVGSAVTLDQPHSATDLPPVEEITVKNEDAYSAPEESQVTPLLEQKEPTNLLAETNACENDITEKPIPPKTENPQSAASIKNVDLHATEVVPIGTVESNTTELAPAVTVTDSNADASNALSETEMHTTDVASGVTEKSQDTEVTPGVAVNDGINQGAAVPETKNLDEFSDEEKFHIRANESDATEIGPGATLSETATEEVKLEAAEVTPEESLATDAGEGVENVELLGIKVGNSDEENKSVEDNGIAPDAVLTASPEVKTDATKVAPEDCRVNITGASVENIELHATTVDKLSEEENKVVEENKVTALPENEYPDGFQKVEIKTDATGVAPEVKATDEVGKLSSEEKKLVEENEKLRSMLEKLLEAGREQLDVISGLSERVKGLEKKMEKKPKRSKVRVKKA